MNTTTQDLSHLHNSSGMQVSTRCINSPEVHPLVWEPVRLKQHEGSVDVSGSQADQCVVLFV